MLSSRLAYFVEYHRLKKSILGGDCCARTEKPREIELYLNHNGSFVLTVGGRYGVQVSQLTQDASQYCRGLRHTEGSMWFSSIDGGFCVACAAP